MPFFNFIKKAAAAIFIIVAAMMAFAGTAQAFTDGSSTVIDLYVDGCNNNGICEISNNENPINCAIDCQATPTTTPTTTPPTDPPDRGGDSKFNFYFIKNVRIVATQDSLIFTWDTEVPSLSNFSWGETAQYEIGSLSETSYGYTHTVRLYNLDSATRYYFSIVPQGLYGNKFYPYYGSVSTLGLELEEFPPNVSNFVITAQKNGFDLTWKNPENYPTIDFVRVLKSTVFYPSDPLNGKIVYEGIGEYVLDKDVKSGIVYYYTIYTHDENGKFSTGVIAQKFVTGTMPENPLDNDNTEIPRAPDDGNPFYGTTTPSGHFEDVTANNLRFIQNGQILPTISGTVEVQPDVTVTLNLSVPEGAVKDISSVIVYIKDAASSQMYTYLLRPTATPGLYQAQIPGLPQGTTYNYSVSIYGSSADIHRDIRGMIVVTSTDGAQEGLYMRGIAFIQANWSCLLIFLVILILSLILIAWNRRRKDPYTY